MTIFIIGYMASGKTTFGRALARQTGMQFIDLDFYIEQRYRSTVSKIFAEKGEDEFRRIEREMLREAGEFEDVVISCGGGTPCFFDNMDFMLSKGVTVWLNTSPDRITTRLIANNSRRPLMAGKTPAQIREEVDRALAARLPHYCRAAIHFPGEELESSRQISRSVEAFMPILNDYRQRPDDKK